MQSEVMKHFGLTRGLPRAGYFGDRPATPSLRRYVTTNVSHRSSID